MKKIMILALFIMGLSTNLYADKLKAREACNLNIPTGCNNLGMMYHSGQILKKDNLKAVELFDKSCSLGYSNGCYNLGLMYQNGKVVKIDYLKAKELFEKACNLGDVNGCNEGA